jgi:integrase/recombinase XerD
VSTEIIIAAGAAPVLADVGILAGQLAPSSIARYRRDVAAYAAWCAQSGAAPAVAASLAQWRAVLAADTAYSPNTINRMIAAVKRVVQEAAIQGVPGLDADTAHAFAGVVGVKVSALRGRLRAHGRTRIAPADMRRLCEAPDPATPRGLRDRALLAVLASSGVRISELCGLQVGNVYQRDGGYFVSVLGKGQAVEREAPLSPEAYQAIGAWLTARPVLSEYVFTGWAGRGAGRAVPSPLTPAGAWQIVTRWAQACGLAHVKPHDFRRFVGTQLAARDIRAAQKALGHRRIDTTAQHYVLDTLAPGLTDDLY